MYMKSPTMGAVSISFRNDEWIHEKVEFPIVISIQHLRISHEVFSFFSLKGAMKNNE